jgi:hypothetical protein
MCVDIGIHMYICVTVEAIDQIMLGYGGHTVVKREDGSWARLVDGEVVEETNAGPDILHLAKNYSHILHRYV